MPRCIYVHGGTWMNISLIINQTKKVPVTLHKTKGGNYVSYKFIGLTVNTYGIY